MADFGSALWNKPASGGGGGDSTPAEDPVTRSLRFDGSSSRLSKTFSSAGNRKTYTFSCWVKKAEQGENSSIFDSGGNDQLRFTSSDVLRFVFNNSNQLETAAKFRDPSGWLSIVLAVDTTQSTSTDRVKIWVNGTLQTLTGSYPSQDATGNINNAATHEIGRLASGSYYYGGYVADIHFIDGEAKAPTDFIESNNYGGYIPKAYTGSVGTNGFHIDAQPLGSDADLLVSSVGRNNGDTTFVDVAAGHTITATGGTEHSIKVGNPFTGDGRAIDFGSSTANHLKIWDGSTGDYNLGSDDFTMEAWYNTNDTKSYMTLFSHYQDANNWFCLYVYTNDYLYWYWETGSTYIQINSSSGGVQWQHHKWNHVAVTKSGTTHKLWLNGVQVATGTKGGSHTISASAPMHLGTLKNSSTSFATSYHGDGYVYDARISSSVRYTDTFDVPTEKFTDDSDTELLLQPDNSDSDWDDVDKSHNSHDVTENGTVTRTASTPYEASAKSTAMYFDGSGDYITTSWDSASDFDFGSSDYTIECWFTVTNTSTAYKTLFSGTAFELNCFLYGSNIFFYGAAGYYLYDSTLNNVSTNTWYHVACQRNGNTLELYFNGDLIDTSSWSGTHSSFTSSTPFRIGYLNGYARTHSGYIYDFRVTKGEAKYTGSTYDTPTAPFELNPVYIGGDQSGNKNHFTPTNISGHDVVLDTPTRNYATWNPLTESDATYSEGNTKINCNFDSVNGRRATVEVSSGKWYWEVLRLDGAGNVGVFDCSNNTVSYYAGWHSSDYGITMMTSGFRRLGSTTSTSNTTGNGDIVQFALDVDAGKLWIGKNGTWFESGDPSAGTNAIYDSDISGRTWSPTVGQNYSATSNFVLNAGADPTFAGNKTSGQDTTQDEFYYAPPTGFSGL